MSQPPRYEFPPATLSSSICGDDYPFSDSLETAAIPPGCKAQLSPPSQTLLHLDFPHDTPFSRTESYRERTKDTLTHPTLSSKNAASVLTEQELSVNFSMHSVRPSGYNMTDATPSLPRNFSAHYHVPVEGIQNISTHFQSNDAVQRIASCRTDAITFYGCSETPSYLAPNSNCCDEGLDQIDQHPDTYNACGKNSHYTFDLHSLNLLEKTASDASLCHFFSLKPTRHLYRQQLASFQYHHQQKLSRPATHIPCCHDVEWGVMFPHSSLHRTQTKTAFYNLNQRHFPYSQVSPRYGDILDHRFLHAYHQGKPMK